MSDDLAFKPISEFNPDDYTPIEDKKNYMPTWLEWASKNYVQILKSTSTKGAQTLYTVPDGQTLYITGAFVGQRNAGAESIPRIYIVGQASICGCAVGVNLSESSSVTFIKPIKVDSGGVVICETGSGVNHGNAQGGFNGFLVTFKV